VGTLPGTGGTQRLPRLIGQGRAIEMMVTGGLVGFEEAHRLGIVNEVWEVASPEEFMEKVLAYAGGFCPPHKAAKAVGRIKRAVRTGSGATLETGLALERELQQQLYESEDAKEGLGAYVAKRKPRFTGR
jgi:enoyl-CoA hydratase/carnithine racemase